MKKLVIITGASSGIGAALAKVFSEAGFSLGLLARNKSAMEKMNLPDAVCESVDVTDVVAVKSAVQVIEKQFGPVECLINNAGVAKAGEWASVSHEDHATTVAVNVQGVMNGIEVVLPGMQTRKNGTIINISSLADRNSRPQLATYAATKAAVKSLTESLRMANAKHNIRLCNIAPAKIATPILISSGLPGDDVIAAEDFARAVLWVFQQPQSICVRDMVFAPTGYEA